MIYIDATELAKVSIPRSEFWSFGLFNAALWSRSNSSFNSSVGILVVRTAQMYYVGGAPCVFQFLGRNSGRSDMHPRATVWGEYEFQFLGRNSGRSDSHNRPRARAAPQSFNSSVGILVVRTQDLRSFRCDPLAFQFLGRNSGRSDVHLLSLDNI